MTEKFPAIQTAELDWQQVDGVDIPLSRQFGDVYFSKANGLLETRHVFLNGNDLTERLAKLQDQQYFSIGETGFGTGLNFLALWQLWQQVRPANRSHLHFISVEKYPLSLPDLKHALGVWTELRPLADQLIAQYPLPLAGCHRLSFPEERISIDLWLGDAAQTFPLIQSAQPVNAWFLDGFAPSCNPELWQEQIFSHIMRLSAFGTSFASFSVAGILKRALRSYGVTIRRPKGFGHKREMLKAIWQHQNDEDGQNLLASTIAIPEIAPPQHVSIIGAGIAGLNCAWTLAQRGVAVTLFEKEQPLSGGSGNPRALLNPKLCPIEQVATHLMTVSWQYALKFYQQFSAFQAVQIYQLQDKNIEQVQTLTQDYPQDILSWQNIAQSPLPASLLHYAGTLSPHQFAEQVLAHPLIEWKQADIQHIETTAHGYRLIDQNQQHYDVTHVIACNALAVNHLFPELTQLKPIRGQVSWCKVKTPFTTEQMQTGFSYGGYALPLSSDQLVFGASFLPHQASTEITLSDHQHNLQLMQHALPDLVQQLAPIDQWQGRASLRAQTPDYFPLVGPINENTKNLYCLAGLGSKGFLFAPLCSEIIVSQMLGEALPVPAMLAHQLRPNRFKKKVKKNP
ncbi:FAD-dependent 5-carboxymethylaminomethyl-2-thiouridine(34) oxidoreductase MnmC [Acinetobacter populi]|uniref:tRNA 5-methylaminomethyl-2-thiouridine biosynthesis bifunctional protein MnmC n=1 Tax=Acinetobacter populi TaxID=1582270 RepID=A0A1Z9YUC2_9GAMM|nr:FAD-dependent 5-carboxymethylaminomethyl-2-thiouridine(34) oxidoreductase MnmC [Acinetobacter populi]OUY05801.1 FAD-dependent cmnm(5)s(2)U34 oxidoreductase [Acinetobacter populi]